MVQKISKSRNNLQKISILIMMMTITAAIMITAGCNGTKTTEALPAPANLKYYFHDDDREIKLAWDKVEGAVKYEYKCGDVVGTTADNYGYIEDVQEGDSGLLEVRACGEDGNTSEWAKIEYSIDIYVAAPKTLTSQVDGKYNYVIWEPVEDAVRYEIKCFDDKGNETETMTVSAPENFFRLDRRDAGNRKFDIRTVKEIGGTEYCSEWKSMTVTTTGMINPMDCTYFESCLLDLDSLQEYAHRHAYMCNISQNGGKTVVEIRIRDLHEDDMLHRLSRTTAGVMNRKPEVSEEAAGFFDVVDKETSKNRPYADDNMRGMPQGQFQDQRGRGMDPMRFESFIICRYEYSDNELAPDLVSIGMLKRYHEDLSSNLELVFGKPDNGFYWMKTHEVDQKFMMSLGSNDNYWLIEIFPSHAK